MFDSETNEPRDGLVRALCELMEDPVAIADTSCSFQWLDDIFPQLFGRSREDFLGRTPSEMSPDPQTSAESLARIRGALLERGGPVTERIVVTSRGKPFWVLLKVEAVFGAEGDITHYVTTAREVSWAPDSADETGALSHGSCPACLGAWE